MSPDKFDKLHSSIFQILKEKIPIACCPKCLACDHPFHIDFRYEVNVQGLIGIILGFALSDRGLRGQRSARTMI
jgi:hypothetical protein